MVTFLHLYKCAYWRMRDITEKARHIIDDNTFLYYATQNNKIYIEEYSTPIDKKLEILGMKICNKCYYNPYPYLLENEILGFGIKETK